MRTTLALLLFAACGTDPVVNGDASVRDDAAVGHDDAGSTITQLGFAIRRPQVRMVPCMGRGAGDCAGPMVPARDADFVCTLRDVPAFDRHYVYAQIRPTLLDGRATITPITRYVVDEAFVSDGTTVTQSGFMATYDIGGGHHNDSLTLELPMFDYRYYHSSFGFGFRRCQEMDCLQIFPSGNANPSTNGCERERMRPVVCVQVTDDGMVPDLTDHFMRCPGDM